MKKLSKNAKGLIALVFILVQLPFWVWFTNWGETASQKAWNTLWISFSVILLFVFLYFVNKNRIRKK